MKVVPCALVTNGYYGNSTCMYLDKYMAVRDDQNIDSYKFSRRTIIMRKPIFEQNPEILDSWLYII